MKIVIAPDSYKGALRAEKVAGALASGWRKVRKGDEILEFPLSDGGEGMAAALANACSGKTVQVASHDALMRKIRANVVLTEKFAVLESAEANGIEHLTREELNPMAATTYGVGEMFSALLDMGCREIVVGIGGSATVDGGAGMLQALGAKLLDRDGNILPPGAGGGVLRNAAKVDLSSLDSRLFECRIKTACDVTNPLCGTNGSAVVFGPQKGASGEMVQSLDYNLKHWSSLLGIAGDYPGDGAAGGLGFALRAVLGAELISGAELVMEYSGFSAALSGADLVITGEGCSDEQTLYGKLCSCVAKKAEKYGVPTILVSGGLRGETAGLETLFKGCFSISHGAVSLSEAMEMTERNLLRMGANLANIVSAAGR